MSLGASKRCSVEGMVVPLAEAGSESDGPRALAPAHADERRAASVVGHDGVPTVPPRRTPYNQHIKPLFDRVVAGTLLVVLSPVLLAVAATVLVSMGRPVLFRQRRVGLGGEPFDVLKFRTMAPDRRRARVDGFVGTDRRRTHKSDADPRLTSVGRFLRKWSLDELPQLLNVWRGEMSLVGPRPELVEIVATRYTADMHARHAVKPGITGLWQVGARGEGLMWQHPEPDLEYVERESLWLDLAILVRTPLAALGHQKGM